MSLADTPSASLCIGIVSRFAFFALMSRLWYALVIPGTFMFTVALLPTASLSVTLSGE